MTIEERYKHLQEQHRQLQEDYDQLNTLFENMGQGYEEALNLYDQAVESSRMKTDFIQNISHEIRTPLNILSGFAQVLTSGMELDEATRQNVTKGIVDNTERITSLVNKMLEMADVGSETPLERNDQVLAIQIAAQAAEDSGITQATHLDFELDIAPEAETAMLTTALAPAIRALVLLLDNAMKFTHPAEAAGGASAVKEKPDLWIIVKKTLFLIRNTISATDRIRRAFSSRSVRSWRRLRPAAAERKRGSSREMIPMQTPS